MIKASFPEWSSMLMIGSPGIGMLEFSISIAKDYLDTDNMVIFVAVDILPNDLLEVMDSFGIEKDTLGRNLFIIDYHSSLLGSLDPPAGCLGNEIRKVSDLEGIMFNISTIANMTTKPVKIFIHSLSTLFLYNQATLSKFSRSRAPVSGTSSGPPYSPYTMGYTMTGRSIILWPSLMGSSS